MRFKFPLLYLNTGLFLLLLGFFLLVISGTILPTKARADASDINVNVAPENPAPGDNVTITLSSYAYDLDTVSIQWSVNGKVSLTGIAKKTFSLNAPAEGAETDVVATLALPDGTIDIKTVIRPTMMVLLSQADNSHVPPFYKGKALPSSDSEVKVVAMPEIKSGGSFVNPNSLIYTWQQDYNNEQDASGYGKNYYIYNTDALDPTNNVSVTASTSDQKYSSNASVDIATAQPKVLFYTFDVNLGTLWETALTNGYKVQGNEVIQAEPYFMSPKNLQATNLLSWNWTINGASVSAPLYAQNFLPLQTQAGVSGTSEIDLEVRNMYSLGETADGKVDLTF
jgi:hypothetical protein